MAPPNELIYQFKLEKFKCHITQRSLIPFPMSNIKLHIISPEYQWHADVYFNYLWCAITLVLN